MALTIDSNDITTVAGASREWDIPSEWIEANAIRDDKKKAWVIGHKGNHPQLRFDDPKPDAKGKKLRYKSQFGSKPDAYIPYCPDGQRYDEKFSDGLFTGENSLDEFVLITEGFKKAIKGCSEGIFTVGSTGIWNSLTRDDNGNKKLVPTLQAIYDSRVRNFIIGYDADCATNSDVHKSTIELAKILVGMGCTVKVITGLWQPEQGKGMDDFISQNGIEAFRAILEKAYTLDAYIDEFGDKPKTRKQSSNSNKKTHADIVAELSEYYGNRIRLNEMTNEIEKDGKEYYLDSSFIHISQETGIELAKTYAIEYLIEVARNNAYHPVVDYLNSVKNKAANLDTEAALSKLGIMLSEITGVTDKLHLTFISKTLVAAVNRVFRPGCFFKRVCVFYGKQDAGKSSFWRELAGDKFFNSSYKGTTDKHDLMSLHSAWINEIAEFDKVYRKTDVANLKAVISDPFDKLVLPYSRTTVTLQRSSILVASTNKQDILLDPTGHTRFWVVEIPGKIDFKSLIEYRDLIWACAYNLFASGYSYELSEDEQVASAANNEKYTSFDPLYDAVEDACRVVGWIKDSEEYVTIPEIYTHLYPELDGKALKSGDWKPIADALTRLDYTSNHSVRRNGKTVKAWKLKKVEDLTVTTVTEAESHTGQALPLCYRPVTVTQPTVTDTPKTLPSDVHGNATVTPTVTPMGQGLQPSVTAVTAETETFSEVPPNLSPKTPLPNGITEVERNPDAGDWVEIISDNLISPLVKGAKFEVSEVCPGYGVKLIQVKKGTAKKNPEKAVLAPVSYKDVRLVGK
ncbi:VapE domain-containing protein [Anabaena sp. UHCC 0451]|uniref:VapE domain-containing protein n=1 Tax=Anabaena sp. UHCC 0451 TaxID=2055235 RepID=UPI002B1F470E|nr:VapE domain-containing protein [Anabaena sp. UHCC 0451]MEA5579432.1 VapE domain-containing protein [Anabaena sp. UHCC 0451]